MGVAREWHQIQGDKESQITKSLMGQGKGFSNWNGPQLSSSSSYIQEDKILPLMNFKCGSWQYKEKNHDYIVIYVKKIEF